jgi:photosystem II stability/assembly factor-like uncharacterized protein
VVAAAPVVESFTASSTEVVVGDEVTLSWVVSDPNAGLVINKGIGSVFGTERVVKPAQSTTYTLFATNAVGTAQASVTVNVSGLITSEPGAAAEEWTSAVGNLVGLESECGNIMTLSAKPDFDSVLVGVATKGIWASWNGSDDWFQMGQTEGGEPFPGRATSFVFDPANRDRFWITQIYGGTGVFRTVDSGASYQKIGDAEHADLISVDFSDPARNTMLVGIHEQTRLFRSDNSGVSWQEISEPLPDGIGYASSPLVLDRNNFLLGTNNSSSAGIFRSTDGGASWQRTFDVGVSGAPLRASRTRSIYWLLEGGVGVVKSDDDGATWELIATPPLASAPGSIVELPSGRLAALGVDRVLVSNADGTEWESVGPTLPYAPTGLIYAPYRQQFLIWRFTCDEGSNPVQGDQIMEIGYVEPAQT